MIEKNSTDGDYFWATLDAHKVVEQRRKALGLSAEFIADKLGINKAWYFDLESESTELSYTLYLWQLEDLMHILGLSMTDLFRAIFRPVEERYLSPRFAIGVPLPSKGRHFHRPIRGGGWLERNRRIPRGP
jgi:transcriptional regulator with XRE-family HTH domain